MASLRAKQGAAVQVRHDPRGTDVIENKRCQKWSTTWTRKKPKKKTLDQQLYLTVYPNATKLAISHENLYFYFKVPT